MYFYTHTNMNSWAHTIAKKKKKKKGKTINKMTMIEREKQKWDLQLSTSFFGSVKQQTGLGYRGWGMSAFHREPHLTSRSAATEITVFKLQRSKMKLIYHVTNTYNPKPSLYSSSMFFKGWIRTLTYE